MAHSEISSVNNLDRKSSRLSQRSHSAALKDKKRYSRRSTLTIAEEESFHTIFKRFCSQFKSKVRANVLTIDSEPSIGNFPLLSSTNFFEESQLIAPEGEVIKIPSTTVCLIYDCYVQQQNLFTIIMRNSQIDRPLLIALRKTIQKFDTLNTLKLEHCNLTNLNLRTLKTILRKYETITNLSINGNPNGFQNHFILLKNTKLATISMRFCRINDRGIKLIANQLESNENQTLVSINLSSNFISDDGVESIADVLRINRTLIAVNLADNWLTDEGCRILMSVLQKFPLRHEEIVVRRNRIMDRLLKKEELIENHKLKLFQASDQISISETSKASSLSSSRKLSKESILKVKRESRKSAQKANSPINLRSSLSVRSKRSSTKENFVMIEEMINSQMEPDNHPFVRDSYPETMEIYCKGNFKLLHLNIAYNKITITGLWHILDMLHYQKLNSSTFQGISRIVLEGNNFEAYCREFMEIEDLLSNAHVKKVSIVSYESGASKRKSSVSNRVSISI